LVSFRAFHGAKINKYDHLLVFMQDNWLFINFKMIVYETTFLNKTRQFWRSTKRPLGPPVEKHLTIPQLCVYRDSFLVGEIYVSQAYQHECEIMLKVF